MADLDITVVVRSNNTETNILADVWPTRFASNVLNGLLPDLDPDLNIPTSSISDNTQLLVLNDTTSVVSENDSLYTTSSVSQTIEVLGEDKPTSLQQGFVGDYYNRIHVTPLVINLGNIVSDITRDVEVWNAYFINKTLTSISEVGTDGLTLIKPAAEPLVYLPLHSDTYEVSISTVGPSTVDASYTYNFPSESVKLAVFGSRVTIFPYEPDWGKHITERFSWKTKVTESYDGTELRSLMREVPRRVFQYDVVVHKKDYRIMDALLTNWSFKPFAMPVWTDKSELDSAVSPGSTTLNLDTTNREFVISEALTLTDGTSFETVEILTVTDTQITLERPVTQFWSAGALVVPIKVCRLANKNSLKFITTETASLTMVFEVARNNLLTAEEVPDTYRSAPILLEQPNYSTNISNDYESKVDVLDNDISENYIELRADKVPDTRTYLWLRKSKEDIMTLKKWLQARYGRQKAIWVPTHNTDMEITGSELLGATSFDIKNIQYTQHLENRENRQDILLTYVDGTYQVMRILGSEDFGSYETLQMDTPSSIALSEDTVANICYVESKRLSSDAVEFDWVTPSVVRCEHSFRSVYDGL